MVPAKECPGSAAARVQAEKLYFLAGDELTVMRKNASALEGAHLNDAILVAKDLALLGTELVTFTATLPEEEAAVAALGWCLRRFGDAREVRVGGRLACGWVVCVGVNGVERHLAEGGC